MIAVLLAIWEFLVAAGPLIAAIAAAVISIAKALFTAAEITAVLYLFYAFLVLLFDPRGKARIQQLLANLTRGGFELLTPLFSTLSSEVAGVVQGVLTEIAANGKSISAPILEQTQALAESLLTAQRDILSTGGYSHPDNAIERAGEAFKVAMGAGLGSAGVTLAFETLLPERLNTLNGVGPIMAEMAGFREVAGAVLDPLYENAFGRSLRYQYQKTFKPDLPNERDAVLWHARGLLTDEQLGTVFDYSGLKGEYESAYMLSAYRALSAFVMVDLIKSGVFVEADLADMLQFYGLRPADQTRVKAYVDYIVPDPQRKTALSALLTAAERGTMTDAEVDTELGALLIPQAAWFYIHKAIDYRRLEQLAELYRKSVQEGYAYGTITDADYVPDLEAIGIAAADAQAHYAVDSLKKHGKEAVAGQRAAARLEGQRTRAAVNAATAEYRTGALNEVELGAALLAAGLDPEIATAAVTIQAARRKGALRYVYGMYQTPADALLTHEKVTAVENQFKKQLITDADATAALANIGIPDANAMALLAAWAAMKTKPTTTGEFLSR